eukprot:6194725-Pleurochrysis_carterae.AAC.7
MGGTVDGAAIDMDVSGLEALEAPEEVETDGEDAEEIAEVEATDADEIMLTEQVTEHSNAPKRALPAYQYFAKDQRKKLREENAEASTTEFNKARPCASPFIAVFPLSCHLGPYLPIPCSG